MNRAETALPADSRSAAQPAEIDARAMRRHAATAARLMRSLANPHRLLVLCVLSEGELSVSELNERIPLSQSALSQHLAVLRREKLVRTRRESQTIYYSVMAGAAMDIVHLLHDKFCCAPPRNPRPTGEFQGNPKRKLKSMKWQHVALPAACQPVEGVIACGLPSEKELREAHAGGLRTVINLCPVREQKYDEDALVTSLGMRYEHIPVAGAQDLTRENALRLAQILSDPESRPAVVHCASGNRVGALFALKAFFADGCDPQAAIAAGRAAGLKALEPAVAAVIRGDTPGANAASATSARSCSSVASVDRLVFRFAGAFVLVSLALAQLHSPAWLWFTAFVGANMLQASFTGFCPLARILARLGIPYGAAFRASSAAR